MRNTGTFTKKTLRGTDNNSLHSSTRSTSVFLDKNLSSSSQILYIFLESGDYLLLEDSTSFLLEGSSLPNTKRQTIQNNDYMVLRS